MGEMEDYALECEENRWTNGPTDYAEDYWTTKEGTLIPVRELTDSHIINIIKYCFRQNKYPMRAIFQEAANRKLLEGFVNGI